jgi:hypothetical protein
MAGTNSDRMGGGKTWLPLPSVTVLTSFEATGGGIFDADGTIHVRGIGSIRRHSRGGMDEDEHEYWRERGRTFTELLAWNMELKRREKLERDGNDGV